MAVFLVQFVCYVIFLLVQVDCYKDTLQQQRTELNPALDFNRYTIVKPKIYHGREKRQISTTKNEEDDGHIEKLQIALEIDGDDVVLDLILNKHLLPKGFFHKKQENGKYVIKKPTIKEVNHCHYTGKVRGKSDSWVALSTCDGLSGVFFDGNELHYIEKDQKIENISPEVDHFVYKHSDLAQHNKTCGYSGGNFDNKNNHIHKTTDNRFLRYKRSTDNPAIIRGPYNGNKDSKYVELVLVVDNREFKELGEDERRVIDHCKNIANIINGLYAPLNIFIGLVGVVIWSEYDEITFSASGDSTLTNFLHYRKKKLIIEHPNDNAQLLTKYTFDQGVVGKALKGPICTVEYSGGVNNDHSPVVGLVATTIAHEMGHNFGMEHDTVDCKCPDERCIMAPSSSSIAPTHWSSCSLNYLLLAFTHGMDYCLKNIPESLFSSPVCGNGFLEPGEQCDCGLAEHCENPCCNPGNCMLYNNASCATGACCDLNTCKPKTAGTVCRSADYECDLPEYCTGESEFCPADIFKMNTEECDDGKSFCYNGSCRTRTDQCKLLWGETGTSSDEQCYDMNTKGSRHGNCGYNKFNSSFAKCANESVLCGMLHCKHLNERLEYGMESVSILSHSFINKKGSIIPCRTAIVDLGTNRIDPGMTPDGAKCGYGKMCVNQQCRAILSLRKETPTCEKDCNGNGWCNNKGHCHCKDGFAPPLCEYPGPGGSEDSGPASDPNARQGVVIAMFIIFLGVVPMLAIIGILIYYTRYNLKLTWKKSQSAISKSPNKSRGPQFPSETAKRNEANHSLLQGETLPATTNINFFGNFKGFSLTPMKNDEVEPIRAAPPPPPSSVAVPPAISWQDSNNSEDTVINYQKPPPPVPSSSVVPPNKAISNLFSKPVQKMNSFKNNNPLMNAIKTTHNTSTAPALPPLNPGSTARPIISSPVLESSTSNAKELVSPLKHAPKIPLRPAPTVPSKVDNNTRPLSTPEILPTSVHTSLDVKIEPGKKIVAVKEKENNIGSISTLSRIASFLKPAADRKLANNTVLLSSKANSQVKAHKVMNRETLRNLKISDPVPQTEIDIAITALPVDAAAKKAVVMRAQSMRSTKLKERPNIQTFGSMRHPQGYNKRPLSIPSGVRPKSPPPPAPIKKSTSDKLMDQYDDCLNAAIIPLGKLSEENSPTTPGDNIYAVIDEVSSPEKSQSSNNSNNNNIAPAESAGNDSLGLLGEIVSEIQNRNFDSIYSTSTLNRKKKNMMSISPEPSYSPEREYENTAPSESVKSDNNEYSNMSSNLKSNASTTSSGYILPSAVNVPPVVKEVPKLMEKNTKPVLSSFRKDASTKPFGNALDRTIKKSTTSAETSTSATKPIKSKITSRTPSPTVNNTPAKNTRQITPPNLKITKTPTSLSSASRNISQNSLLKTNNNNNNRSVTNSPDLVTSCNTNSASKEKPDVLNGGTSAISKKPSISSTKPIISSQKPSTAKLNKAASFKKVGGIEVKPPIAAKIVKTNSDVSAANNAKLSGVKLAARSNSNVANLQQKFEEKIDSKS